MKKTFTKEEFTAITNKIVADEMKEAESRGIRGNALMAFIMSYIIAFGELKEQLFNDDTDTIEITTDKEF